MYNSFKKCYSIIVVTSCDRDMVDFLFADILFIEWDVMEHLFIWCVYLVGVHILSDTNLINMDTWHLFHFICFLMSFKFNIRIIVYCSRRYISFFFLIFILTFSFSLNSLFLSLPILLSTERAKFNWRNLNNQDNGIVKCITDMVCLHSNFVFR